MHVFIKAVNSYVPVSVCSDYEIKSNMSKRTQKSYLLKGGAKVTAVYLITNTLYMYTKSVLLLLVLFHLHHFI